MNPDRPKVTNADLLGLAHPSVEEIIQTIQRAHASVGAQASYHWPGSSFPPKRPNRAERRRMQREARRALKR